MIRIAYIIFTLILGGNTIFGQDFKEQIVTSDIDNFWFAYDQINK